MHTHDGKGTCNLEKTLVRSHSLLKLAATDLSSLKELVSILNHLYITLYRRITAQDKILVVRPPPPSALHHLRYLLFMYCKGQTAGCLLLLQDILGWGESDRGVSYTFGRDIVQEFLETHNLSLICRAHQVNSLVSGSGVPHHMQKFSLQFILLCSSLGPRGLRPGPAVCPLQYMKSRYRK